MLSPAAQHRATAGCGARSCADCWRAKRLRPGLAQQDVVVVVGHLSTRQAEGVSRQEGRGHLQLGLAHGARCVLGVILHQIGRVGGLDVLAAVGPAAGDAVSRLGASADLPAAAEPRRMCAAAAVCAGGCHQQLRAAGGGGGCKPGCEPWSAGSSGSWAAQPPSMAAAAADRRHRQQGRTRPTQP